MRARTSQTVGAAAVAVLVCACIGTAAPSLLPAAFNTGGGSQTGSVVRCISSVGQPVGGGFLSSASYVARSGMLFSPLLDPSRDADADGVPDEDSPDDDADGLTDLQEILGSSFSPATTTDSLRRDTDGDGISDRDESVAGTDPLDPTALLRILAVGGTPAGLRIEWTARGGRTYGLLGATNVVGLAAGGALQTVTAGTGTGTWQVTRASATNSWPAGAQFMTIRPQ